MALPERESYTEAEYLAFERESEFKHEYIDGQIVAMTGGTGNHSAIAVSTGGWLSMQLPASSCRVYNSDMRVRAMGTYTYPDLSVVCGEPPHFEDEHNDTLLNPVLIGEVLPPSTERFDRGLKFYRYRAIPTLQAYLLIWQSEPHIEQYVRQPTGEWLLSEVVGLDHTLALPSIDCDLPLAMAYKFIQFEDL